MFPKPRVAGSIPAGGTLDVVFRVMLVAPAPLFVVFRVMLVAPASPFIPEDTVVSGWIYDVRTGRLQEVVRP